MKSTILSVQFINEELSTLSESIYDIVILGAGSGGYATALRAAYQEVLTERGFGPIQTVISPAPDAGSTARFWYAEDYHQQYLFKNPGGYECHARTGIACPALPHE